VQVKVKMKSFFRRALPSPPATAFASDEGKQLFGEVSDLYAASARFMSNN